MRKISIAEFRRSLTVGTEVSSIILYTAPAELPTVGATIMAHSWVGASTERKIVKQSSYEMALTIGRRAGSETVNETVSYRQYNKGGTAFTDDDGTFWIHDDLDGDWDVPVNAYRIKK